MTKNYPQNFIFTRISNLKKKNIFGSSIPIHTFFLEITRFIKHSISNYQTSTIADTEMSMANNVAIATIKVVTPMLVASAMKHVTPSMAIVVKITGSPATMILNFVSLQQQVSWKLWNLTPPLYLRKNFKPFKASGYRSNLCKILKCTYKKDL